MPIASIVLFSALERNPGSGGSFRAGEGMGESVGKTTRLVSARIHRANEEELELEERESAKAGGRSEVERRV